MFSVVVLFIVVVLAFMGLYVLLGRVGMFKKVGDAVKDVKTDIDEKNTDTHKKENKGSDV